MCGIAVIIGDAADPARCRDAVAAMLDAISHRGPDGMDIWQGDGVTFGHCRLAILDTSVRAAQPILTADAKGVLVYNGEIYNAGALRDLLKADGCVFTSSGDTEVVLQALHRWGPEKAVPLFNGMFALAYLDRRNGSVWLARDRLGIKPLVIARCGGALLIASEVKALHAHPAFRSPVRTGMIARWIGEPRVQAHLLLAEGVHELPPGAIWQCAEGETRESRYFAIPEAVDPDRIVAARHARPSSLVDAFGTLIEESTVAHMASDAPLATMCSGGVDSSLITALARRAAPDLVAYVADLKGTGEADAGLKVGRHLGVEMRQVTLDRKALLRLWPLAVHHADGPLFHASDMALMAVANAARADGFKVLLTGEGSDELFGGYRWHAATRRQWLRLEGLRGLLQLPRRKRRKRMRMDRLPFISPWSDGTQHRTLVAFGGHPAPRQRALMRHLEAIRPTSERALAAACLYELGDHLRWLLHRHDRMGMAASIEMRVPFLENGLIDFALHLPPGVRIRHGKGKWLVKAVAERHLPHSIVHAPKKGFPVPPAYWMGCESMLVDGHLERILGWTRQERDALMEDLTHNGLLAFHLVSLELWLGHRLDGQTPEAQSQHLLAAATRAPVP